MIIKIIRRGGGGGGGRMIIKMIIFSRLPPHRVALSACLCATRLAAKLTSRHARQNLLVEMFILPGQVTNLFGAFPKDTNAVY